LYSTQFNLLSGKRKGLAEVSACPIYRSLATTVLQLKISYILGETFKGFEVL